MSLTHFLIHRDYQSINGVYTPIKSVHGDNVESASSPDSDQSLWSNNVKNSLVVIINDLDYVQDMIKNDNTGKSFASVLLTHSLTDLFTHAVSDIDEIVDERLHSVMYKIDKSRRLIQGDVNPNSKHNRESISKMILEANTILHNLIIHFNDTRVDLDKLQDIATLIDELDNHINSLHKQAESIAYLRRHRR